MHSTLDEKLEVGNFRVYFIVDVDSNFTQASELAGRLEQLAAPIYVTWLFYAQYLKPPRICGKTLVGLIKIIDLILRLRLIDQTP